MNYLHLEEGNIGGAYQKTYKKRRRNSKSSSFYPALEMLKITAGGSQTATFDRTIQGI